VYGDENRSVVRRSTLQAGSGRRHSGASLACFEGVTKENDQLTTHEPAALSVGEGAGSRVELGEGRGASGREAGLERVREILLGGILSEIERRLGRIDSQLANRSSELQQDARHRTDVLDAHVRKEIETLATRVTHDSRELKELVANQRGRHREEMTQLEQRLTKLEDRIEASLERVERETRQLLLDQAKLFLDELERVRHQLRSALIRELGLEPATLEERGEHDAAWTAPH
jgi:hypothetical protein